MSKYIITAAAVLLVLVAGWLASHEARHAQRITFGHSFPCAHPRGKSYYIRHSDDYEKILKAKDQVASLNARCIDGDNTRTLDDKGRVGVVYLDNGRPLCSEQSHDSLNALLSEYKEGFWGQFF